MCLVFSPRLVITSYYISAKQYNGCLGIRKHKSMHSSRDYDVVYWILSDLWVSAKCM